MKEHILLEYTSRFGDKIRLLTNESGNPGTKHYLADQQCVFKRKYFKLQICGRNYTKYSTFLHEKVSKLATYSSINRLEAKFMRHFYRAIVILNENKVEIVQLKNKSNIQL